MTFSRALASLFFFVAASLNAQSAIVHDIFFRVAGTDQIDTTIFVSPSEVLTVEAIFRETVTSPDMPNFGDSDLSGVALDINTTMPESVSEATRNAVFFFGSLFDDDDTMAGAAFGGNGLEATMVSPGVFEGVLGTVQLTAPLAGNSTVFTLADAQPTSNNFDTFDGGINDSDIGFRSLTITAVPEPSGFCAMAVLAAGCIVRRRRR